MYLLALENKMDTDPEFLEEIKRAREGILARMYTKFLEKNVVITEKDKRRYYVKNKEEFKIPYMWDFRRIEVKTKEECEEILEKLKKGEDFSELAKKFSVAPEGKRGGLIRHFTEKSIPEEFVPVLKTMRVGEIRGPIKLKTGNYAIIKLEKKTPGRYRGYEEVEKHIEGMLRKEKTREMWEKWEKEVFKRFEVKYFIEK
jgi:peptidyl-prolyl cis-trans isomerase C